MHAGRGATHTVAMVSSPRYTVLLVGGSSGTGKTTIAAALSRQLGMTLANVDDFRLFSQQITTPATLPDLHFFIDTHTLKQRAAMAPEALCERLIRVAHLVSRGLEVVIAHHVDVGLPIILEGDGITPEFAAKMRHFGSAGAPVGAVFLLEPDEQSILIRMAQRGRGISQLSRDEQLRGARLSWLFGNWIGKEAHDQGVPVVSSSPIETAVDRVLASLSRSR